MAVGMVRRRSKLRPWLILIFGLVLFMPLGWTVFWRFAADQAAASLDAWIAREKAFHRVWTCPDRHIAGFPFAIKIACHKPHFAGNIFGRHYSGSLDGFIAKAKFTHPDDVAVKVVSPFAVVSDDKTINLALT